MLFIPVICTIQVLVPSRRVAPILFSHLKNDLFLIRSTILCTGSLNATFTSPICGSSSYILKSFHGLEGKILYRERFNNGAFPLLYSRSSLRHLYSSICLISCFISSEGLFVNDSRSWLQSSRYPRKFHCKAPNTDWHNCEGFHRPSSS